MTRSSLAVLVVLAAAGAGAAACREVPPPADPGSRMRDVVTPDGAPLPATCVPTGPENCFDARDDNCNGVIDEGCGLATGILQFVVAWGDAPADVDLLVTEPGGATVGESVRRSPAGLRLDKDCPGEEGCHDQNVENVVFEGGDPPRGTYRVEVRLVDLRGAAPPISVRVAARVGRRTYGTVVELSPGARTDRKELRLTLRAACRVASPRPPALKASR